MNILYLEMISTYMIAEAKTTDDGMLVAKSFVSTAKVWSKNSELGKASQILQALFASGMDLTDIKRALSTDANADEMDIDGLYDNFKKRKVT